MRRSLLWAGIFLPVLTYAQNADSSRQTLVTTAPKLGGVTVTEMVAPITANGNTFTLQQTVVDAGVPVYKKFSGAHPLFIKTGIRYEGLHLSGEEKFGPSAFHSFTVPLLVNYSLTQSTNLTFIGLATVASDLTQALESQDILYTAGVRLGFRPSKTLRYGVTLTYIHNYSGNFLIPIPDLDWEISQRLSLSAVLPARASLKYKLSPAQSLGVTMGYAGAMYKVNDKTGPQYLNLQQYSGGLIYDVRLGGNWKLNVIAGHTFMQRLETFRMDQKVSFDNFGKLNDRVPVVSYRENSFVLQAGISYAF